MNNEEKFNTMIYMQNDFNTLIINYIKILKEYHETGSRDSAFLKDAVDSILGIQAVLEVYARDKEIHPEYAIEKLSFTKRYIEGAIDYYKSVLEQRKDKNGENK